MEIQSHMRKRICSTHLSKQANCNSFRNISLTKKSLTILSVNSFTTLSILSKDPDYCVCVYRGVYLFVCLS